MKQDIYVVIRPFGGKAKGDEISLSPRQAQFLVASGQIELKGSKKAKAKGSEL